MRLVALDHYLQVAIQAQPISHGPRTAPHPEVSGRYEYIELSGSIGHVIFSARYRRERQRGAIVVALRNRLNVFFGVDEEPHTWRLSRQPAIMTAANCGMNMRGSIVFLAMLLGSSVWADSLDISGRRLTSGGLRCLPQRRPIC